MLNNNHDNNRPITSQLIYYKIMIILSIFIILIIIIIISGSRVRSRFMYKPCIAATPVTNRNNVIFVPWLWDAHVPSSDISIWEVPVMALTTYAPPLSAASQCLSGWRRGGSLGVPLRAASEGRAFRSKGPTFW